MGFAIPRIQYNNVDTTGTVSLGSGDIGGISDTTDIVVGMFVKGDGIPAGATVGSKTDSSVTLAGGVHGTSNESDTDLQFGYEINFDFPPKEVAGEMLEANSVVSVSLSGVRQVSTNNIEATRKLIFSFLSPATYTLLDTFLKNWGLSGKAFRYFEDKTLSSYVEFELNELKTAPKKLAPRGVDTYVWEVPLTFRRVL